MTNSPEGPGVLEPPYDHHTDFLITDINGVQTTTQYDPKDNAGATVIVYGGSGDNTIQMTDQGAGQHWNAEFHGGPGNNTLIASTQLFGKRRVSYLYGGGGNNTLIAGAGKALLVGGTGPNTFVGGTGASWVLPGPGPNTITPGTGYMVTLPATTSLADAMQAFDAGLAGLVDSFSAVASPASGGPPGSYFQVHFTMPVAGLNVSDFQVSAANGGTGASVRDANGRQHLFDPRQRGVHLRPIAAGPARPEHAF
jgi:hypothetical protein